MVLVSYDSDGDDVPVVEVQSSEVNSRNRDSSFPKQKEKLPPPLPANFQNLYSSNVRSSTTDDPALHGGRQRQVPHVVGNWPAFVYLEWVPRDQDLASLDKVIIDAASQLQASANSKSPLTSSLRSDLGVRLPLHISLSTPLVLTTDNKDEFEKDIKASINAANISKFHVVPASIRWVHNFDRSRYFLILTLHQPERNELQRLLSACNSTAKQYGLPELYAKGQAAVVGVPRSSQNECETLPVTIRPQDDDKFHISIGWTLQAPASIQDNGSHLPERMDSLQIDFDRVCLKVGSNITTIPLE